MPQLSLAPLGYGDGDVGIELSFLFGLRLLLGDSCGLTLPQFAELLSRTEGGKHPATGN